MLTITKDHILGNGGRGGINPDAEIHLFGQEVNPETLAVCKSDLFMKDPTGRDADNIMFGSTLSNDRHAGRTFDYLIANPPYGKDWKRDEDAVEAEHERGFSGRFGAGLPRISDGQLLFLQHMLAHMKPVEEGGSRVAIIMNGSPLFTGDAGSGESEIRRWILENDWLEALIALPEQLFYNTGIATYVWVLTQPQGAGAQGPRSSSSTPPPSGRRCARASATSAARSRWTRRNKSFHFSAVFKEGEYVKIFPTTHFGFRKITVERPLRLNFQATSERIARIEEESAFRNLAVSKKKNAKEKAREEAEGRKEQEAIRKMLGTLPGTLFKDRFAFESALDKALKAADLKIPSPLRKAILSALSERDETANICRDSDGNPEPDPELRDTENVPLSESIETYFEREVNPYVPDAWINTAACDDKDKKVGKVGYEINFNRYFYKYTPPRPLEEIEADIKGIEKDVLDMLREVAG